ncbi:hypothetical protein CD798_13485 [Bacillaceae bacterium SAOS 7]|nr:hypothetical protein CD798_13485 [Bacillaceae bacterium SAOS 7]
MNTGMKLVIGPLALLFLLCCYTISSATTIEERYMKTTAPTDFSQVNEATGETMTQPIPIDTIVRFLSIENDRTQVEWNGQTGYIASQFLQDMSLWDVHPNANQLQTTTDSALYKKTTGGYKKMARVLSGEILQTTGEEAGYMTIDFNDQPAYIAKSETIPVIDGQLPGGVQPGFPMSKRGVTKYTTNLLYSKNGQLTPLARVQSNEPLLFIASYRDYFITKIGGRTAYVNKKDVILPSGNYVNPLKVYTYEQMTADLKEIVQWYPGLASLEVIGKSVDGRNLYALKLGKGREEVFINASHHAREHITTNVTMEMIDQYAYAYETNKKIDGYAVKNLLDQVSIYFVPMVNPDGVSLVQKGANSAKNPAAALKVNRNQRSFAAWKANVRGVDLNRQYPAGWPTICCDPGKPHPQNYKGPKPLSEPETKALYDFTLKHRFKSSAAYHSSGQIIFWHFYQSGAQKTRDYNIAKKITRKTGYQLVPPKKKYSGGGYTDWFIQSQKKPGFTIEVAPYVGHRPVPMTYFSRIWKQNHSIGLLLANERIK